MVASLCGTRLPAIIMTGLFLLVGVTCIRTVRDRLLLALLLGGAAASVARLVVLMRGRQLVDNGDMTIKASRDLERSFCATYVGFAVLFGAFAARAFMLNAPQQALPVAILVVGYAAGAAATTALRPRIVVTSMLAGVLPSIAVLLLRAEADALSAICLLALLAGGLRSVGHRYHSQSAKTVKRQAFAQQARTDHLTGVGNRLALTEAFEALAMVPGSDGRVGIHYVDLDNFKPVNDVLGHATGDALLRLVAERLTADCRPGDVVTRIGGDEFVLLRVAGPGRSDLEAQASTLEALLAAPYCVGGSVVEIGASVGWSYEKINAGNTDDLLEAADVRLRERKAQRKSHDVTRTLTPSPLAHAA